MAITRILLATDFDSVSNAALTATESLAVTLPARVQLLYVLGELAAGDRQSADHKVKAAVDALRARGVREVDGGVEAGAPRDVIAKHATSREFDLLVVGSHGRGTSVRDIIEKSSIPVMAVPQSPPDATDGTRTKPFQNILVPTDFEDSAVQAVELATGLARAFASKITLVHAERPPADVTGSRASSPAFEQNAYSALESLAEKARKTHPAVETVLAVGPHWERILEVAKRTHASLIVMGTHGKARLSRVLLGSVAEQVVNMSSVPVLTVSAPT